MALASTCLWDSLDDIKPWLGLTTSDVSHDVLLEQLANSVTEELEQATARVFVSRAISQTFSSVGVTQFVLRGYPVTVPLTTFTIDGTAVETASYTVDASSGIVTLTGGERYSTIGTDNVVIAYTAGVARASLPASVVQCGLDMLIHAYMNWSQRSSSGQSLQYGNQTVTPHTSTPWWIKDKMARLRTEVRGGTVA